ncbi:LamG-like jellyroll fold domain-containing protein, partial [Anaerohalosphaeraceae bacterium U12dextr]
TFQSFFNGLIENVQIYNRALTAEEIKDLAK